ncbi:MAG: DUF6262 family protein [Pseudonocardiaceae bacterium]
MRADNTRFLLQAARDRHDTTMTRAQQALRRLDRTGTPVSFRAVAEAADVSRAWLYRQPELRAEIDRLRAAHPSSSAATPPTAQRGTDESRQRRIEALLEDNTRLRAENTRLREHVARLLGERRDRPLHTNP